MSRFKAIIFDLDGTLLDSMADIADSMNMVLEKAGFPLHPAKAYRYFIGDGMDVLVKLALPENKRQPENIAVCLAAMQKVYSRNWAAKTRPYPGIAKLLNRCEAIGFKMGISVSYTHLTLPTIYSV